MRPFALRVVGTLLIGYGLVGVLLLALLATSLAAPLDEIERLAGSVAEQRSAALEALDEASTAARETATTVRGMDTSLVQAKAATDRAAGLSSGVALSMRDLAGAMAIDLFGVQPLIGLADGFNNSAANLDLLAADLASIGTALDDTRGDAGSVASSIDALAASVEDLRLAVAGSPDMSATLEGAETLRLGLLALLGWLIAGAIGCILGGLACWWAARRPRVVVVAPHGAQTA